MNGFKTKSITIVSSLLGMVLFSPVVTAFHLDNSSELGCMACHWGAPTHHNKAEKKTQHTASQKMSLNDHPEIDPS